MHIEQEQQANHFIDRLTTCAIFAETLAAYLVQTRIRQIHLARRMYVEAATVHNWRTNKRLPDRVMVYKIGKALGLSSEHRKVLNEAWRVTRLARELIPCVEEAVREGDMSAVSSLRKTFDNEQRAVSLLVRRHVQTQHSLPVEAEQIRPSLDPEIWLYTDY